MSEGYESQEYALLGEIDGQELDGLVFCAKAYQLFEAVRNGPDGVTRLRMLRGPLVGRLVEEVLPMCRYIQEHYRAGRYLSVKWLSGSQSFDAMLTQRGALVDNLEIPPQAHVEVTSAMHANEYLMREALQQQGWVYGLNGLKRVVVDGVKTVESHAVAETIDGQIREFADILVKAIQKKTTKVPSYPQFSTLVVRCLLNTLYAAAEWNALMDSIKSRITFGPFLEIYVYDEVFHHSQLFKRSWIGDDAIAL